MDNKNNLVSNQLAAEYPHNLSDIYIRHMNPIDRLFEALEKKEPTHFAVKQYKKYKLAAGVIELRRTLHHYLSERCFA